MGHYLHILGDLWDVVDYDYFHMPFGMAAAPRFLVIVHRLYDLLSSPWTIVWRA